MYYEQVCEASTELQSGLAPGMAVCGAPGDGLDLDIAVREAEALFAGLFPAETFFPPAQEQVRHFFSKNKYTLFFI